MKLSDILKNVYKYFTKKYYEPDIQIDLPLKLLKFGKKFDIERKYRFGNYWCMRR